MFSFIPHMITVCLAETSMSWSYFSFYMIFIEVKRQETDNIAEFSVLPNPVLHTPLMEDMYLIPSSKTDLKIKS